MAWLGSELAAWPDRGTDHPRARGQWGWPELHLCRVLDSFACPGGRGQPGCRQQKGWCLSSKTAEATEESSAYKGRLTICHRPVSKALCPLSASPLGTPRRWIYEWQHPVATMGEQVVAWLCDISKPGSKPQPFPKLLGGWMGRLTSEDENSPEPLLLALNWFAVQTPRQHFLGASPAQSVTHTSVLTATL